MSVFLLIILLISIIISAMFGSAPLALEDVMEVIKTGLFYRDLDIAENMLTTFDIVWLLRLPRIILAICIGAGLSVCGVVIQAIVQNPLADPYILGVSSGASLGATTAIMLGLGVLLGENAIGTSAFIGAFIASVLVLVLSNIGGKANSVKLVLAGTALNAVFSAFSSFIIFFANDAEGMQTIVYWLMGSMSGAKWSSLVVIFPVTVLLIGYFCSQSRILNLMLLGDDAAITLGHKLNGVRILFLMLISIVIGLDVYAAGIVGFVGLIIPHISRILVGVDHKKLIPFSAFLGAIFLLWADVLCRVIISRTELPIGILVSLVGAPTFIYLMLKKSYGFGSE